MPKLNLGKQVGPLPLGAWIAVVGGGLVIAYFVNKRQQANAEEPPVLTSPDSDVGVGGGQFQYDPIQTLPTEPAAPAEPDDNAAWGRKAINYLQSLGFAGNVAQNTISKFLSGMPLNATEKGMLDIALLRFGSPPEPIAPTDDVPTPPVITPPTSTPPPAPSGVGITQSRRVNTLVWTFPNNIPIGGFLLKITDLKTHHSKTVMLGAKTRNYRHPASPAWTNKTAGTQQYYIRAFKGGFTANKVYGPGVTVSKKHAF